MLLVPPTKSSRARGSSRLSGSPLEPLTRGMTKTSNQLKTHKIEMFCGNTRKIERSRLIRMCTCTIEQDEVFKLPTAANVHCEKKSKYCTRGCQIVFENLPIFRIWTWRVPAPKEPCQAQCSCAGSRRQRPSEPELPPWRQPVRRGIKPYPH